jgi:opine dehydrogenase
MKPRFCVIGAGHGGLAMAGYLGLAGFRVALHSRSPEQIDPVRKRNGVQLEGSLKGFGPVEVATTDAEEGLAGCDVVMVVVPATAHRDVAEVCAPHLTDEQIVVLNPGRTFGAIEFRRALEANDCTAGVIVAEAQSLLVRSRVVGPGQVKVFRIKNVVPLAALRVHLIPRVLDILQPALPQFVPGDNVFNTGLNAVGPALHPAQAILNAARIEDGADFEWYGEGVSPSVCHVLESIDEERVAIAETLGIRGITARQWFYMAHNVSGSSLYEVIRANPSYRGVRAPRRLTHRYVTEDIPTCLVPVASIGRALGRPAPTMDSIIDLASAMTGTDFRATGRTVQSLGLTGMSVRDLRLLAIGGRIVARPDEREPEAAVAPAVLGGLDVG